MIKVIYSYNRYSFKSKTDRKYFENEINSLSNNEYEVIPFDYMEFCGFKRLLNPFELDTAFQKKDASLMNFYETVRKKCKEADVFFVDMGGWFYHPDFIRSLKDTYNVLYSGDDPESSYFCSKPYLYSYDHTFCAGVYYDSTTKMTDKFNEWGAKRADFKPYGCRSYVCYPNLTEDRILTQKRDIDIIYVGDLGGSKEKKLIKLKEHFGKRFRLYSKVGLRGTIGKLIKYRKFIWVERLPQELFVSTYQKAKIGINMHLSYGPSNLRVYELPANGIMQICDNKKGLGELFELGKEVIGYDTTDEAIELIEYYLEHEDERKKIASAGFKRAIKDYKFSTTFYNAMEKVKKGMKENGIKKLKEGTFLE